MKKIFGLLFIVSIIIFSCKKDTPTPAAPVITYGAWSDCSNGVQTRTYTVSGGTATAPADSLQRACDYSGLKQGTWKVTADSVYIQELNQTIEILSDTSFYAACEVDDTYTFTDNSGNMTSGAYTYTDAGSVCSPVGSSTGTWAINRSTNSFIWDGQTTYAATMKYFNGSKLVLWTSFTTTSGGVVYNLIDKATYTKQ